MLKTLFISNYALIDWLEISFGEGLNIVTGETGSGKSIVLGALALIMGERADSRTISDVSRKTIVEARFDVADVARINSFLENNDIDTNENICILRREITVKGSSRAFVNDTPVNLTTMKTVASMLLDIHTQHENLLLTDSGFQTEVLDTLADNSELLAQFSTEYAAYKKSLQEYSHFKECFQRSKAESEYNAYLLTQLDELNLQPGEQKQLEHDREIIANSTEIKLHLTTALNALSRDSHNALGRLSVAENELTKIASYIADSIDLTERLESARIEINDIVETLEEYDSTLKATDGDLEDIERRLGNIYSLQARHNVSTEADLISIRNKLRELLEQAENGDEQLIKLEEKAKSAKRVVVLTARKITERRKQAADIFCKQLIERAVPIGMANLRCEIRVSPSKLSDTGMDNVEFLFAFNKNQPLMPVGKTASGGEISRVILAIKSLLVEKMQLPTIIFDEVDTGVSGDLANKMARLMQQISRHTQVIAITHIATVAAHGQYHFKVYKQDSGESTHTYIKLLNQAERQEELAVMISGKIDDTSLQTAKSLIEGTNHN